MASIVDELTGTQIGRYTIHTRLGAGGMGEVYLARDTQLKRSVALKRLAPELRNSEQYRQQLLNEARRASAFNDPRIASIYDVLEQHDELFVVMEYVDGYSLRERLQKPISVEEFLKIAVQCLEGLKSAHENGTVHGDLKPENVMVVRKTGNVKICDFGLARRTPSSTKDGSTQTVLDTGIRGTPAYMAPEVLNGQPTTISADIFSLGVMFYEMVSGVNPFRDETILKTAGRILSETPKPLTIVVPSVPASVAKIVARMLEKEPQRRYASAAELLADLQSATPAADRHRTKNFVVIAVVVVVIVAFTVFVRTRAPYQTVSPPAPRNLVVIPFEAIGADSTQQSLARGLSDTLNASLVKLTVGHSLQVSPPAEIQSRRVKNADDARQELGANLVLAGSVQFSDRLLRINCVLIDGKTNKQISGDTVTADMGNLFAVQDRIVQSVLKMLDIRLQPVEQAALMRPGTIQPGAYEFYLQGRGYLSNYDRPENVENAINLFQKALQVDSNYVLAYAGLGEAYWHKFETTKAKVWVIASGDACQHAASIDAETAVSQACLGTVHNGTGEYEKAVNEFTKAVQLDPTMDVAYLGLGLAYEKLGQAANAEQTYRRAIEVRPQYWASYNYLGGYYFKNAKYRAAREMFSQVVNLAPDSFRGYNNLGIAYFSEGQDATAAAAFEKSLSIRPQYAGAALNLGTVYFYQGNFAGAADAYRRVLALDDRDYLQWANLGAALEWSGDSKGSREAYTRARTLAEERLKVNPRDARVLMDLAKYNGELGLDEAALNLVQRSLAISPDDPKLMFDTAVVFEHNLHRRDDALLWLAKALKQGYSTREIDHSPSLGELRKDPRFLALRNNR